MMTELHNTQTDAQYSKRERETELVKREGDKIESEEEQERNIVVKSRKMQRSRLKESKLKIW